MTRNLKLLGLALVAVFAMSAVGAGAASAAEFHSPSATTNIEGSQTTTHVFKTTAGEVTCKTATFKGTQTSSTAIKITTNPFYSGCHISIFGFPVEATVAFNGCDLDLFIFNVALTCPAGKSVTITAPGCTVTVGAQSNLSTVTYTNNGNHIDPSYNISKLVSSHTGSSCGTGSDTAGTYKGTTTMIGKDTSGNVVNLDYS